MSLIKLAIDRQSRKLVSYNGSATALPDLFQSNNQNFQIQVVDPDPTILGGYTAVDLGSSGLRVSVGATPTGTTGGPTPLAIQNTWTWVTASKWFTGALAMNTAAIDSHIGTAASVTAYFEINITDSGDRETILQITFNLRAVVDELASNAPSPTDQYLTKAEVLALFVKFINTAGDTVVFKSPDGVYGREIGVANDGTAVDNVIVL